MAPNDVMCHRSPMLPGLVVFAGSIPCFVIVKRKTIASKWIKYNRAMLRSCSDEQQADHWFTLHTHSNRTPGVCDAHIYYMHTCLTTPSSPSQANTPSDTPSAENDPNMSPGPRNPNSSFARTTAAVGAIVGPALRAAVGAALEAELGARLGAALGGVIRLEQRSKTDKNNAPQ